LIGVGDETNAPMQHSLFSLVAWLDDLVDLVALFIVMEVCKKKPINPILFIKKESYTPFKIKNFYYFTPKTKPSFNFNCAN